MKVLIIAPRILKKYLGPSTVAYNTLKGFLKLQKELEKNDIDITFLSLYENVHKEFTPNIRVIGSPSFPHTLITGEIQALFKSSRKRLDIIHSHNIYEIFPGIVKRIPTIFTLHGLFWKEGEFSKQRHKKLFYTLATLRLRLYYPYLTKLVTISHYNINELKNIGFDTSKIMLVENPISNDFFNVKKGNKNIILYPAAIIPRKNHLGFLKAISLIKEELADFEVIFTGSGNLEYLQILKKFLKRNNLNNVKFLGKVPYETLMELYSKASIMSLVSFEESFGMVVAEAMATGTPVLVSNIPVFRDNIKEGKTGLLADPNNPKDIAEKLLVLINNKKLRRKIGKKARVEAEKRWKCEKIAEKLLSLYSDIYNNTLEGFQ